MATPHRKSVRRDAPPSPPHEPLLAAPRAAATIGLGTVVLLSLLAWGLVLAQLAGAGWAGALLVVLQDGATALAILLAAGGFGGLLLRPLLPKDAPPALLATTAIVTGLWVLSTALLVVGRFVPGGLSVYLWWPIVLAGVVLAAVLTYPRLRAIRLPQQVDGTNVLWIAAAAGAAFWIAGAAIPPGFIGTRTGDFYDVVSYHLQIPREFHQLGHVAYLPHNTYSQYPLGAHMLFLLGMILRGGPYEGVYAAKLTHGLFGVLAVVTLAAGLPTDRPWRRRIAGALLATVPLVVYLSWLAFVELAALAYLAVGIAWLAWYARAPSLRAAALVGLSAGGACATKYLAVGFVAGPLLAVLLALSLRRRRPLDVLVAALLAAALLAPWLVRNAANTGNPVFPLATGLFGRGPWSEFQAARWDAAHAPPTWDRRPWLALVGLLEFGAVFVLLAFAAAVHVVTRRRRAEPLDWIALAVLALQVAVWVLATHMPGRFLVPAAVPMAILVGGFTGAVRDWTPRSRGRGPAPQRVPVGFTLAVVLVLAAALLGLSVTRELWKAEQYTPLGLQGATTADVTRLMGPDPVTTVVPANERVLMVGDVHPFLSPENTVYTSTWEPGPLVEAVEHTEDPRGVIDRLRDHHRVRWLLIHWGAIERYRRPGNYGWWPQIDEALIDRLLAAGARSVPLTAEGEEPLPRAPNGRPLVELIELRP